MFPRCRRRTLGKTLQASSPPHRAVTNWGQENIMDSMAACFSGRPAIDSTSGAISQRNPHLSAAPAITPEMWFMRSSRNQYTRHKMALPAATTGERTSWLMPSSPADHRPGGQPRPGGKDQQDTVDQGAGDELADAEGPEDNRDVRNEPAQILRRRHQGRAHGREGHPGSELSVSFHIISPFFNRESIITREGMN